MASPFSDESKTEGDKYKSESDNDETKAARDTYESGDESDTTSSSSLSSFSLSDESVLGLYTMERSRSRSFSNLLEDPLEKNSKEIPNAVSINQKIWFFFLG